MPEPTGLEGLRILIAEDNLFAAMELEQTLLTFGCQPVGPVARLDQALSLALSEDLDGALLDVELQGQMVFAVAEELQRRRIPMIFASGYGTDDVFPAAFVHHPRLSKPFGEEDVRRALAAMVAGRPAASAGGGLSRARSPGDCCRTAGSITASRPTRFKSVAGRGIRTPCRAKVPAGSS